MSDDFVVKYHVVFSDSFKELGKKVNRLINKGWQPLGGIALTEFNYESLGEMKSDVTIAQAMIGKEPGDSYMYRMGKEDGRKSPRIEVDDMLREMGLDKSS